jgi:hypothetical protein
LRRKAPAATKTATARSPLTRDPIPVHSINDALNVIVPASVVGHARVRRTRA